RARAKSLVAGAGKNGDAHGGVLRNRFPGSRQSHQHLWRQRVVFVRPIQQHLGNAALDADNYRQLTHDSASAAVAITNENSGASVWSSSLIGMPMEILSGLIVSVRAST